MWGGVAALVYFIVVSAVYWNAANCHGMFCDVGTGLAVLPWALMWGTGAKWFWIAAVINAVILYLLFAALQKWMQRS